MVRLEPKVDSYQFLGKDFLSNKIDYYLNISNNFNYFGPAQHVNQRQSFWLDLVHFVHKDFNFKIGRIEHTIPIGQLIATSCFLCAGLLALYLL